MISKHLNVYRFHDTWHDTNVILIVNHDDTDLDDADAAHIAQILRDAGLSADDE